MRYGFVDSLGIGFVLSLLGSIFLFLGSLTSFACTLQYFHTFEYTLTSICAVLYAIGTVIALIGTGFLIGVCPLFLYLRMLADIRTPRTVHEATQAGRYSRPFDGERSRNHISAWCSRCSSPYEWSPPSSSSPQ